MSTLCTPIEKLYYKKMMIKSELLRQQQESVTVLDCPNAKFHAFIGDNSNCWILKLLFKTKLLSIIKTLFKLPYVKCNIITKWINLKIKVIYIIQKVIN